MKKSLYKELKRFSRGSEDSSIVASAWGVTDDPYLPEIPGIESGNAQCRESYFSITAERLLFRMKLLGLSVDENLAADANIVAAHPFGEANPTFGELLTPSVRLAAAFVPLTPDENDVTLRPVMARLYCVAGFPSLYPVPFTEGLREAGIQNYNWFVAGVKNDVLKMGISGRSWLLAANLLMRIIEKNDMATARNLINNFVVTGNVKDGVISHVTIGRKPELANIKEFRNLKWIIPMKNANEMTTVPVRRIEPPETLQEAYELIESMQNKATRSFFRFLKKNDLVGMKEQYDMGADIFANDAETGLSSSEYLEGVIKEKREELGGVPKVFQGHIMYRPDDDTRNWNKRIELTRELISLDATRCWLRGVGSNCSDCIYMLAKLRLRDALAEVLHTYPINAKNENGLTATDMAIIGEDSEAARLLMSFGGMCDTMGIRNPAIKHILENIRNMTENMWDSLELAMDAGLSLDTKSSFIDCETNGKGAFWDTWKLRLPLRGRAIYEANERLLRLCMSHGMDLDKPFLVEYIDDDLDPESTPDDVANHKVQVVKSEMMKPLEFAQMIGKENAIEILKNC